MLCSVCIWFSYFLLSWNMDVNFAQCTIVYLIELLRPTVKPRKRSQICTLLQRITSALAPHSAAEDSKPRPWAQEYRHGLVGLP